MLRLWPEEIQVGLFADHCWLRKGRSGPVREYPANEPRVDSTLLERLAPMLDDPAHALRPGAKVALLVSDALAALTAMPWQPALDHPGELRRYAEVCFEKQGTEIDSDWSLHAQFRHYEASGLAYALPAAWLAELHRVLQDRGLRLGRVLPASAAAYFLARRGDRTGRQILLLRELRRTTALSLGPRGLDGLDVEPVTSSSGASVARLLRRLRADANPIANATLWTAEPQSHASPRMGLAAELPDTRLHTLAREALHAA